MWKTFLWNMLPYKRICSDCGKIHTKKNPVRWCDGWHWLCKDCDNLGWETT